jgi:GR25 family glycosyltransferase involved in LPS biosynthesis
VISLPDAVERRRTMASRLAEAGIAFRFVDAVDGRKTRFPDVIDGARLVREPFDWETVIACMVSHRRVHRMIAEGDADMALVLEDDARLSPDFADVVREAMKLKFDVFKLEGVNLARRRLAVGRIGAYEVIVTSVPSVGSAAYMLRRPAARRMSSFPVIDHAPDLVFGDPRLGLRVLEMSPFCVRQDGETETQMRQLANPAYVPEKQRSIRRLVQSTRRKFLIAKLHGPATLLRLELQRIRPRKRAAATWSTVLAMLASLTANAWFFFR